MSWPSSSSSSGGEEEGEKDEHSNSFLLIIMFGTHFLFFLFTYFWLYPADESPKTAVMHKLTKDIKKSRLTGEPIRPTARLSIREISYLSRRESCPERNYHLTEEDQKTLQVVREGEVNYLKQQSNLFDDPSMNYGSLIVKRGVPAVEIDLAKESNKDQIENIDETAVVEDLIPLRRQIKEVEKQKKKRKTKERMDALDQLTRAQSAERIPLFSRIIPQPSQLQQQVPTPQQQQQPQQSRKVIKKPSASSTIRGGVERTLEVQTTMEDDKTLQKVIRKPSSKPQQKPSAVEINVKKKKSGTLKEGRTLTLREELSLARTMEETTTTRNKGNLSSREPAVK